jgi:polyhydroxyalkanoate synthesis regulator phasin
MFDALRKRSLCAGLAVMTTEKMKDLRKKLVKGGNV